MTAPALLLAAALGQTGDLPGDAANASLPAVVTIRVTREASRAIGPFGEPAAEVLIEQGGVLLAGPDGRPAALTTFRAAAFAPTVADLRGRTDAPNGVRAMIRTADGRSHPAAVRAADPHGGLAVFSLLAPPADLPTARLSDDPPPGLGGTVATVCPAEAPPGPPSIVARAVVGSGLSYPTAAAAGGPSWSGDDPGPGILHAFGTLAGLSPPPPPGCSGGTVFDERGELIGLLVEPADGEALPPRMLPLGGAFRRVMAALLASEPVGYGLLGVEPSDVTADAAFAALGEDAPPGAAAVGEARGNSPAERAGLRRGDWIAGLTDADGVPHAIRSAADLVRLVSLAPPGGAVALEVVDSRTGERRTATATLATAPTGRAAGGWPAVATEPGGAVARGLRADWPTAHALPPPGEPFPAGVLVVAVAGPGIGGDRPVRVGDRVLSVGDRPVDSPAAFAAALAEADGAASLRLADGAVVTLPPP